MIVSLLSVGKEDTIFAWLREAAQHAAMELTLDHIYRSLSESLIFHILDPGRYDEAVG